MCPNRHSPDYPIEDSVHRHSNTNIQRPSHSPWPPRPTYHVIRGWSDHHEQKGPSHTSTERPQLKPSADWLTRTASHLSTKWVWTNVWIFFWQQWFLVVEVLFWFLIRPFCPVPHIWWQILMNLGFCVVKLSQVNSPVAWLSSGDFYIVVLFPLQ